MDNSVDRTGDRIVIPASHAGPRIQRQKQGGSWSFHPKGSKQEPKAEKPAEAKAQDEPLPAGQATHDEAGKRLDVTA